ncbi:antagonist of KipI [Melghirimyces profundicolus]|uniref:Antagonist of KipI n=2 Tax=Melghirimyces profundicolus TaxID=1242148 RepID=A0A2T6BS03_9BACL|nr:antagonist of KipI [Melghirimyces profundicolus]
MGTITVVNPGLLTTVQDLGRTGYQQFGMVVSGAMDPFSLQVGNILVGNPRGAAGLEITLSGPVLRFEKECLVALTGADLSPLLDDQPAPMWKGFSVGRGQVLSFRRPVEGIRAYLTVSGGIDVPEVMGSRSTYINGGIGGYRGRALEKGDVLTVGVNPVPREGKRLAYGLRPRYGKEVTLRAVPGPQSEAFTEEAVGTFFSEAYEVTPRSDRMGYRLKGPRLFHKEKADILSDAIAPGSVQVPAEGQPIVLLADRQTTGGYAKIATVISADLPRLAQAGPGCRVRFERIDVAEAEKRAVEQENLLRTLEIGARNN